MNVGNASVGPQNGPKSDDQEKTGINTQESVFDRISGHNPQIETMDFSEVKLALPENVFLTDKGLRKYCPHCGRSKKLEEFPESTAAEWGRKKYCFRCGGVRRKRDD